MADEQKTTEIEKRETQLAEGVEPTREGRMFLPRTDIRETDDAILLTADMPGVKPGGVDITLEKNVLTVHGHCGIEQPDGELAYSEYETGDFQRSFSLSHEIDQDGIKAHMSNGVLTLLLPKAGPTRTRIEVQSHEQLP
jgi:HSP20 family molecular chaperone IbpA